MPRSTKRASTRDLDVLHRLTVKSLVAEMRRLKREKLPVPPALLTASIKLLTVTGSTDPERPPKRQDRPEMAALLAEHAANEARDRRSAEIDFSLPADQPARGLPDEG